MNNHFKPHIVELDSGKFAIRKLTILGYRFTDAQDYERYGTWSRNVQPWFYQFHTFSEANSYLKKILYKPRIIKVYEN